MHLQTKVIAFLQIPSWNPHPTTHPEPPTNQETTLAQQQPTLPAAVHLLPPLSPFALDHGIFRHRVCFLFCIRTMSNTMTAVPLQHQGPSTWTFLSFSLSFSVCCLLDTLYKMLQITAKRILPYLHDFILPGSQWQETKKLPEHLKEGWEQHLPSTAVLFGSVECHILN